MSLDPLANRQSVKYTRREQLGRVLWALCTPLFRLSPRPFFGWRRWLLRAFGAHIGQHVNIYPSARITMPWNLVVDDGAAIGEDALIYNLGMVTIGASATISQRAHLCAGTHDYTDRTMPLLKEPVTIGPSCWICADAFVGPGVSIGEGTVVGARAVVMRPVEPWKVVAGNPARVVKDRVLRA